MIAAGVAVVGAGLAPLAVLFGEGLALPAFVGEGLALPAPAGGWSARWLPANVSPVRGWVAEVASVRGAGETGSALAPVGSGVRLQAERVNSKDRAEARATAFDMSASHASAFCS